jgi:uncharacterized protein (TIGR03083 family)
MNDDELWAAIDAQRERLATFFDGLSAEEWSRQSLCSAWTVRDVAGHLTYAQITVPQVVRELIRTRRGMTAAAIRRAQRPTGELVATIRGMIGSRKHVSVVTPRETLIDILVHSQDVAIPLGRPFDLDRAAAVVAAGRVWELTFPFGARRRFKGRKLVATDADFTRGEGEPLERPIGDLLLLLTGRRTPTA